MKLKTFASGLLFAAGLASASFAATDYDGWVNLTSVNFPGHGTGVWPSAIGSNAPGSGDATFDKVSGNAYTGTYGVQTAAASSFTIVESTPLSGVQTITLEITYHTAAAGNTPVLNYNGGGQALAPSVSSSGNVYTYEWDVSAEGTITSFDIDWSVNAFVFATIAALDLTQED